MSLTLSPIEMPSRKLFLTDQDFSALELKPGITINLRAGSASTEVQLTAGSKDSRIATGALNALDLPLTHQIRLRRDEQGSLRLGPVVGIMISRGKKHKHPPHSSQTRLLELFLSYSRQAAEMTYVFSPAGVDIKNRKIKGYYLRPDSSGIPRWTEYRFPLPDVVYDRILYRTYEQKQLTKKVKAFLAQAQNIGYFNPRFLNKWETYTILVQTPTLRGHLPDTSRYTGRADLATYLDRFGTVYLKPINGSLGKGILRISCTSRGYAFQYRDGKRPVTGVWGSLEEAAAYVSKFVGKTPYVVQQGLDLIKYQGRVFDIRVLLQKNGAGRWIDSAMVARIGMQGSIFPNVAAGGEAVNLETLWPQVTGKILARDPVRHTIKRISLAAGHTLEKALGTFGEIGLDIGVDSVGRPWIIEINSKPSRKVFPKEQHNLKIKSTHLPMDFAAFLAGFGSHAEHAGS